VASRTGRPRRETASTPHPSARAARAMFAADVAEADDRHRLAAQPVGEHMIVQRRWRWASR